MAEYYGNINDYMRNNGLSGELSKDQFARFQAQRPLNSSGQVLTNTQTTQFQQPTSYAQAASPSMATTILDADQAATIPGAVAGQAYTDAQLNVLGNAQADAATGGFSDFFKAGEGGSTFSNTAQGLGSLYGIYATHKGIGAAKDALNFEKQKYGDLKALQAKSDANKEKFGLALQSASKANGLIK